MGFCSLRPHYSKANLTEGTCHDRGRRRPADRADGHPPHAAAARIQQAATGAVSGRAHGCTASRSWADVSRRRWWPLAEMLDTDRLQAMFDAAAEETGQRRGRAQQLAATFAHVVIGRVDAAGGARGPGLGHRAGEPLGARRLRRRDRLGRRGRPVAAGAARRSTGARRRSDRRGDGRAAQRGRADDVGRTPQPPGAGAVVRQALRGQRRRDSVAAMWHIVGSAVVGTATQLPVLARQRAR